MYKIQNTTATALRHQQGEAENQLILNNLQCMLSVKQCTDPVSDSTLRKNIYTRYTDKGISFDKGCLFDKGLLDDESHTQSHTQSHTGRMEDEDHGLVDKERDYSKLEVRKLRSEGSLALEAHVRLVEMLDVQTKDNTTSTACVTPDNACIVCVTGNKEYLDVCNTCYNLLKQFCGSHDKRGGRVLREL